MVRFSDRIVARGGRLVSTPSVIAVSYTHLGRLFPFFNKNIRDVVTQIASYTRYGYLTAKEISDIHNDLSTYMLLSLIHI